MGICFPSAILGGWLSCNSPTLHTTFVSNYRGRLHFRSSTVEGIHNLRELSWKGLLSGSDCGALKAFLELLHERLASLEMDFIDWAEVEHRFDLPAEDDDEDESTPLIGLILPIREDE